jgi:hypothetical protein
MAISKGNVTVALPAYLYRRLTQYDKALYRRMLPLVLLALHHPAGSYQRKVLDALCDNKLQVYLEELAAGKVLTGTTTHQGAITLRLWPVRGGQVGERTFGIQMSEAKVKEVEALNGERIPLWSATTSVKSLAAKPLAAPVVTSASTAAMPSAEFHIGTKEGLLQREGNLVALPLAQARQVAQTQAYLEQRPYYLYQVKMVEVEVIDPEKLFETR